MTLEDAQEPDDLLEGESSEEEEATPTVSYDVSSYGSDPEVEVLVNRLRRGDIIIPPFQRDYVWRQPEASKFIESLLLGLPVPGVFFATEPSTNKQLVIDGQQRLKTLLFFFDGYFNPRPEDKTQRVFALTKVQKPFEGKTYKTLGNRSDPPPKKAAEYETNLNKHGKISRQPEPVQRCWQAQRAQRRAAVSLRSLPARRRLSGEAAGGAVARVVGEVAGGSEGRTRAA